MRLAVAVAVTTLAGGAFAANEGCTTHSEMLVCELQVGKTTAYVLNQTSAKSLKLVNKSKARVQINQVRVEPAVSNAWGEYCITLRDLSTGQNEPGFGEVACIHKDPAEGGFAPLQWGEGANGLSVPPGADIYVGGYVQTPAGKDFRKTIHVAAQKETSAVSSFRQPPLDEVIKCNGAKQSTKWAPWKNTTGRPLTITGATIYAVDPAKRDTVEVACLAVLDASGSRAKWEYCDKVNVRGRVRFPPVTVAPNEYVAGRAHNRCAANQWDWAAYIHVK